MPIMITMILLALALPARKANYDLAIAAYLSIKDGKIENTKLSNDALETVGMFESVQKEMNSIWLEYLKSETGELDSVQYETAYYWAYQCPLAYGPGVYTARGILRILEQCYFDDVRLCNQVGLQFLTSRERYQGDATVSISPNPSNGFANLFFREATDNEGELSMTDFLGRPLATWVLPKGIKILELDLANYPNGLYFFNIVNNGETKHLLNHVIIKE